MAHYNIGDHIRQKLWLELDVAYASPARHYHIWAHIARLCDEIARGEWADADRRMLLLAAFYHDAVYDVLKHDNEEQSALLAAERMQEIGVAEADINWCCDCIRATKSHTATGDAAIDFFPDADLAILGAPASDYEAYTLQIRREYSIYPDEVYKPGRRKVLEHFLSAPRIYKTAACYDRLEAAARANLMAEADSLRA